MKAVDAKDCCREPLLLCADEHRAHIAAIETHVGSYLGAETAEEAIQAFAGEPGQRLNQISGGAIGYRDGHLALVGVGFELVNAKCFGQVARIEHRLIKHAVHHMRGRVVLLARCLNRLLVHKVDQDRILHIDAHVDGCRADHLMALIPRFLALRALHARDHDHKQVAGRCVPHLSPAASFDVGMSAAYAARSLSYIAAQISRIAVSLSAELDHLVVSGDPQHFVDLGLACAHHSRRPFKKSWWQHVPQMPGQPVLGSCPMASQGDLKSPGQKSASHACASCRRAGVRVRECGVGCGRKAPFPRCQPAFHGIAPICCGHGLP